MKTNIGYLIALLLAMPYFGIGQKAKKNGALKTVDVEDISIHLKFDSQQKKAIGNALLKIKTLCSISELNLDAGMLSIQSIERLSATTQVIEQLKYNYNTKKTEKELNIQLGKRVPENTLLLINIYYSTNWVNETDPNNIWGSYGKGIRYLEPSATEPLRKKQIWSVGEINANKYWFPCIEDPSDLRTTTFSAKVKNNFRVISNGECNISKMSDDSLVTYTWRMNIPYSNHLTAFVIGEFAKVERRYNNTSCTSYCYNDEIDATKASVKRLPDMMHFLSNYTQCDYPYKNYSQTFVQEFAGWMGNTSASIITENMIDDEGTHNDFYYLWDITEGESLANQWFGGIVAINNWDEYWLNKSFARYFSGLYSIYKNGEDEFLAYQLLPDHLTYFNDYTYSPNMVKPIYHHYQNTDSVLISNMPYTHGASILHLLHKQLGDEKWKQAIQLYVHQNKFKTVTTQDFLNTINKVSETKIDWFFNQWIYNTGHPIFEVKKNYDSIKQILTLNLYQKQAKHALNKRSSPYFEGKMEIEIDTTITSITLKPRSLNTFTFSCLQNPKLINADYQSSWIKELQFNRTTDELIYLFLNSKDILARISALDLLCAEYVKLKTQLSETNLIATEEKRIKTIQLKIETACKQVIASNNYWRLRAITLTKFQNVLETNSSTQKIVLDSSLVNLLCSTIKNERSWIKANALRFLGITRDKTYEQIYVTALSDSSDRVVNAAAIALGKCKSANAFHTLIKLKDKPSWKNQSLISTLNGLQELGDTLAIPFALDALTNSKIAHWTLATPKWDHRLAASDLLHSFGTKASGLGYRLIVNDFNKAMLENNINDIFYNTQQIVTLAHPIKQDIFTRLREKFKTDANALMAIDNLEAQFAERTKNLPTH